MPKVEGKNRPTAWGHRFGPELLCSECGLTWDQHQADPGPCGRQHSNSVDEVSPGPKQDNERPAT